MKERNNEAKRNQAIELLRNKSVDVFPDGDDYVKCGDKADRVHKDKLVELMEAGTLELDTILRISCDVVERLASEALRELDSQREIFEISPTGEKAGTWTVDFVDEAGEHVEVAIDHRVVGMDEPVIKAYIRAKLGR